MVLIGKEGSSVPSLRRPDSKILLLRVNYFTEIKSGYLRSVTDLSPIDLRLVDDRVDRGVDSRVIDDPDDDNALRVFPATHVLFPSGLLLFFFSGPF